MQILFFLLGAGLGLYWRYSRWNLAKIFAQIEILPNWHVFENSRRKCRRSVLQNCTLLCKHSARHWGNSITRGFLLCMRRWFLRSFNIFSLPCTIINFLFTSWQMITETLFNIPFSVIGRCSIVPTFHWLQGKLARYNFSQAASGMILQNHRWLTVCFFIVKTATLGSLKRNNGRFFKISKWATLWVWFFHHLE